MVGRASVTAHADIPVLGTADASAGASGDGRAASRRRRAVRRRLIRNRSVGESVIQRHHILLDLRAEGANANVVPAIVPEDVVLQLRIGDGLARSVACRGTVMAWLADGIDPTSARKQSPR